MAEKYIDYTKMLINYKGSVVYVVVDSNNTPWFNANDVSKLLDYTKTRDAIQLNVSSEK